MSNSNTINKWQRLKNRIRIKCQQWLTCYEEDNSIGLHGQSGEHLPDMHDTMDHSHFDGGHDGGGH